MCQSLLAETAMCVYGYALIVQRGFALLQALDFTWRGAQMRCRTRYESIESEYHFLSNLQQPTRFICATSGLLDAHHYHNLINHL